MPRVAICVPSTGQCQLGFVVSLLSLLRHVADKGYAEVEVFFQEGCSISSNRWALLKDAKGWGATHLFFLDEDMVFGKAILRTLLSRDEWSVGANYPMRSDNHSFTAMDLAGNERVITDTKKTGLEQCTYIPSGCSLTKMELFDKLAPPFWAMDWIPANKGYTTEDVYFYTKIKNELGLLPYVDHDVSRQVEHIGKHLYNWLEVLRGISVRKNDGTHTDCSTD